jgi:hypothetical protein
VTGSIALVTCAHFAEGEDAQLRGPALGAVGMRSSWQVWSDPAVDWSAFDLAVLRSTWDYPNDRHKFLAWARSVPRLANAADVVAWNSDKRYLRDIAAAGVPVVPTEWSDPGEPLDLPTDEFVVKPSVGAGSRGVGCFGPGAHVAARTHAAALHDVAPDGSGDLFGPEQVTSHRPDPDELRLGERVMAPLRARFGGDLLYARVDLVPAPGGPVVLELELTEPSLFFHNDQDAAMRFAAAVSRRL